MLLTNCQHDLFFFTLLISAVEKPELLRCSHSLWYVLNPSTSSSYCEHRVFALEPFAPPNTKNDMVTAAELHNTPDDRCRWWHLPAKTQRAPPASPGNGPGKPSSLAQGLSAVTSGGLDEPQVCCQSPDPVWSCFCIRNGKAFLH